MRVWSCVEESPVGTHSAERLPTASTTAVESLLDVDSCLQLISLIDNKSPKVSFRMSMAILCQEDLKSLLL